MTIDDRGVRLIESDAFPFEFVSRLAQRESWRKEVHRPIYHVHKWWAKRLGSVFRGILMGCTLPEDADLESHFYRTEKYPNCTVFDPFMGSGTTIGEAHKLGFTALGRDINPVAVEAVTTALGPLDRRDLVAEFDELWSSVGERIRALYHSADSRGRPCDVLYYFWVMQGRCPVCQTVVDLFPSYVIARNANPRRRSEVQHLCPSCGDIFPGCSGDGAVTCRSCGCAFDPNDGPARGANASCPTCLRDFPIIAGFRSSQTPPNFRLYGKLVLTKSGGKEYLAVSADDHDAYRRCTVELERAVVAGHVQLPTLDLQTGYNTRQAMRYGFKRWRDFFNDRQLLALGLLHAAIRAIPGEGTRRALHTLFSGVLEFNNLFASYKGEGTGAVRHMFSHHILKPERTPIEANVWGTPKSSGSFSNLFRSRLLRAIEYREMPTEVNGLKGSGRACSPAFSGELAADWPVAGHLRQRAIYLSQGDSAGTGLPEACVDFVVTDPPFFDNVHYSELADFFYAWQQLPTARERGGPLSTRCAQEVQDPDAGLFSEKLRNVLSECHRVLKDEGLLVFTYHHSRHEGWMALANAILAAGFVVANSHPVKAEMSVATPKSQAREPIQFDIILVCRKACVSADSTAPTVSDASQFAREKLRRLRQEGFAFSRNDLRVVLCGQLLTTLRVPSDVSTLADAVDAEMIRDEPEPPPRRAPRQQRLFDAP